MKTIFAVATPPIKSSIAVFRISGPLASTCFSILSPISLRPRIASFASLRNPADRTMIDTAIALFFPSPHSLTGEDVVELHVHGGLAGVRCLSKVLGEMNGVRMAERGEFMKRAFLNGKVDLVGVEGVKDLVEAETEEQRKRAVNMIGGDVSRRVEEWRIILVEQMAKVEAVIDFGDEEEIGQDALAGIRKSTAAVKNEIHEILKQECGEKLRDGIRLVVSGRPNAGKSSFFNLLARREASIVSNFAGTTRDVVEVHLDLNGFPVIASDTAGIHENPVDSVEEEGIRRARERVDAADVHLRIIDATDLLREDFYVVKESILLLNKCDLLSTEQKQTLKELLPKNSFLVSCKEKENLSIVVEHIASLVQTKFSGCASSIVTSERHRQHLKEVFAALNELPVDVVLMSEHIRRATMALSQITGHYLVNPEEVLDVLFSQFCIGK